VPSTPSRLVREGKGEAGVIPVRPPAGLPAVHKALIQLRAMADVPLRPRKEDRVKSCLFRGCFVQCLI